jgi:hypothetical protein
MSDARWMEVEVDVQSALLHFGMALRIFDVGGFDAPDPEGYARGAAFMHAMQSAHTSAEQALVRVLDMLDEEKPTGEQWHQDVISRLSRPLAGKLARPALLPRESAKELHETRRFRNLALRSYNSFEPARATPAVAAARRLMVSLGPAFSEFKRAVDSDPPAEDEVVNSPAPPKK